MAHHREPFTPRGSIGAIPLRNRDPPLSGGIIKKERMLEVTLVGANHLTESPLSASEKGQSQATHAHTKRLYATVTVGRIRKKTGDSKIASNPVWNSKILLDVDSNFDADGNPKEASGASETDWCTIQIWRHVDVIGDENGEEISVGKLYMSRQDISPLARDRSLAWYPLIVKTEVEGCCSLESCMKPKVVLGDKVPQVRVGFRWAWRDTSRQRHAVSTTPITITQHPVGPNFSSLRPPLSQKKELDRGRETYTRIPNTHTPDFVAEHEDIDHKPASSARACLKFDVPEEDGGNRNARQKKVENDEDWFEQLFTQIGESLGVLAPDSANLDQCFSCKARPRMQETMTVVAEGRVGVGLNLISNDRGDLVVAGIQKAGPAGRSGKVQLGDVLVAVDGQEVGELMPERGIERAAGMDWDSVLLGEEDSDVELTLKRYDVANLTSAEANGSHSIHRVLLHRRRQAFARSGSPSHARPTSAAHRPSSTPRAHRTARPAAMTARRADMGMATLL